MKAKIFVHHPEAGKLFAILLDLNMYLGQTLKTKSHARELIWSVRSKYGQGYYTNRPEETIIEINVFLCKQCRAIDFVSDDIELDVNLVSVPLSEYSFTIERLNGEWVIKINKAGTVEIVSIADATKIIVKSLRRIK
ncbi:MAG: hypothetical protein WC648_00610 [Candidatus Paceibacterota bacterium]|jgi:hypothetical protein